MPITPSYSWSETPTWITVDVLLQSVSQSTLDITTTECFIKVNCLPYLFQADLYDTIDTHKSSAMVDKNTVKFYLVKKTERLWQRLTTVGDRKQILERRQMSLDAIRDSAQKTKAEAGAKLSHIRRLAVGSQMKLEEARRKTIEERKEAELKQERDSLSSWKKELENSSQKQPEALEANVGRDPGGDQGAQKCDLLHEWKALSSQCTAKLVEHKTKDEQHEADLLARTSAEKLSRIQPRKLLALKPGGRIIPAPRRGFRVPVSFTQKLFPSHLPARESRERELQFKKQMPVSDDTVDVSERSPLFLQDKGDKFYRSGDFKSAINAYTDAIQKDPSMVLCYANRAASLLRAKQFRSSIQDCAAAIRLLKNETPDQVELDPLSDNESPADDRKTSLQLDLMPLGTLDLLTAVAAMTDDPTVSTDWNRKAESCILLRRGSAKCHQGDLQGGASDLEEVTLFFLGKIYTAAPLQALKLNPSNTDIKRVLDFINPPEESSIRVC